jgi:hypothetical protein
MFRPGAFRASRLATYSVPSTAARNVALPAMHGKSIRAIALFPGDSKILVVGTLDGVFAAGQR